MVFLKLLFHQTRVGIRGGNCARGVAADVERIQTVTRVDRRGVGDGPDVEDISAGSAAIDASLARLNQAASHRTKAMEQVSIALDDV